MKYFVLAKQNDNNPEIELWIESHNSFESSYITVTSKGFNTSLEAKKWLDKFKTGSMI